MGHWQNLKDYDPHRTGKLKNAWFTAMSRSGPNVRAICETTMHWNSLAVAASLALSGLLSIATLGAAGSAENAAPGAGNALAIEISGKSALVRSAKALIDRHIREMQNAQLRTATEDAVDNPTTCVRHRAGLAAATKAA